MYLDNNFQSLHSVSYKTSIELEDRVRLILAVRDLLQGLPANINADQLLAFIDQADQCEQDAGTANCHQLLHTAFFGTAVDDDERCDVILRIRDLLRGLPEDTDVEGLEDLVEEADEQEIDTVSLNLTGGSMDGASVDWSVCELERCSVGGSQHWTIIARNGINETRYVSQEPITDDLPPFDLTMVPLV